MAITEIYARGLARRELEPLHRGSEIISRTQERAFERLLHSRDLSRKLRPRDFSEMAGAIADLSRDPAFVRLDSDPRAQPQRLDLSWVLPSRVYRQDAFTAADLYDEAALNCAHALHTSDGKRFRARDWVAPCHVSAHLIRRYIEREAGEAVTAARIADLVAEAGRWAVLHLRAHTLDPAIDTPHHVIAPYGNGLLLGFITLMTHVVKPRAIVRDRRGLRTETSGMPDVTLTVAWQTFVTRDMLRPRQDATLTQVEAPLQAARASLARDRRLADGLPWPGEIPRPLFDRAREDVEHYLGAWLASEGAGFTDVDLSSAGADQVSDAQHAETMAVCEAARAATRRLLWPDDLMDRLEAA